MPRARHLQSWLLAALVAAALVLTSGSSASAAQPVGTPSAAGQAARALPGPRLVDTDHTGSAARRASSAWTGRTIRYYETIPGKWDWSLSTAVSKWNGAGGGIRFVRTTVRRKAQLTIGYGATGRAAGLATVGRTRHAYVRLSRSYDRVDALDAFYRIQVLGILTHELGHVLGFSHTSSRCSLMSPVLDVAGCGMLPTSKQGYYTCRMVDGRLAARFVRIYGGRVRPSASWCLIDRLPGALGKVAFEGGSTAPVTAHWTRPSHAPAGSRVVVTSWSAAGCGAPPSDASTDYLPATAGSWQGAPVPPPAVSEPVSSAPVGPDPTDSGDATTSATVVAVPHTTCVSLRLVNRYGAGPAPVLGTVTAP